MAVSNAGVTDKLSVGYGAWNRLARWSGRHPVASKTIKRTSQGLPLAAYLLIEITKGWVHLPATILFGLLVVALSLFSTWGVSNRIGRAASDTERKNEKAVHADTKAELAKVKAEMERKLAGKIDPDEHRAMRERNDSLSAEVRALESRVSLYGRNCKIFDLHVYTPEGEVDQTFEFVEHVGSGGMGTLERVKNYSKGGRDEVIKRPHSGMVSDEIRARLLREARVVMGLEGPWIARVYGYGEENGRPFFSMEYVRGPNLAAYLEGIKCFPLNRAADLGIGIADNMAIMHRAGIVHRDLKPDNIMFRGGLKPVFVDFGLALDIDQMTRMTQAGIPPGTPAYMSPEQVNESEDLGVKSDLYSFGAIFFQMVTGRLPYPPRSSLATTPQLLAYLLELNEIWKSGEIAQVASRIPNMAGLGLEKAVNALQRIFDGALQPEPTDRFNDNQLIEALYDFKEELRPVEVTDAGDGLQDKIVDDD